MIFNNNIIRQKSKKFNLNKEWCIETCAEISWGSRLIDIGDKDVPLIKIARRNNPEKRELKLKMLK
jgi:hypothetical protein